MAVFTVVPGYDGRLLYKSSPADIQAETSEKQDTIHSLHRHAHTDKTVHAHIHKTDYCLVGWLVG